MGPPKSFKKMEIKIWFVQDKVQYKRIGVSQEKCVACTDLTMLSKADIFCLV